MLASVAARASADPAALVDGATASETLAAAIGRVAAGDDAVVGTERDGWVGLTPT
jgi:hypothetical protein